MKVVILAGGQQSTLSTDQEGIPKPMAEIGERPLLWHIMKMYAAYGLNDFIVCGGYKVNMIKEYFTDFYVYQSDITVDLQSNTIEIHKKVTEDWKVTVVNTGLDTSAGERVVQIKEYLGEDDFIVTYGDCLSDIDFTKLIEFHKANNKLATLVVAKPSGRNMLLPLDIDGNYTIDDTSGTMYGEATTALTDANAWVNANVTVFSMNIFSYLEKNCDIEKGLFISLAKEDQICTYKHQGFWTPVETTRDRDNLECLWRTGKAKWKVWQK